MCACFGRRTCPTWSPDYGALEVSVTFVYQTVHGNVGRTERYQRFPPGENLRASSRIQCRFVSTILAKMCGTKSLFPELLQYSLAPPFSPDAMLDDSSASLSLRTTLHGGRGGRIWPKERLFPCEKLIDGRGSAFCKLVPHNFGHDCRLPVRLNPVRSSLAHL